MVLDDPQALLLLIESNLFICITLVQIIIVCLWFDWEFNHIRLRLKMEYLIERYDLTHHNDAQ